MVADLLGHETIILRHKLVRLTKHRVKRLLVSAGGGTRRAQGVPHDFEEALHWVLTLRCILDEMLLA